MVANDGEGGTELSLSPGSVPAWVNFYVNGASLRAAAKEAGVSHEQVRKLLKKYGVPQRGRSQTSRQKRANDLQQHGAAIRSEFFRQRNVKRTARVVGIPEATVRAYLDSEVLDWSIVARVPRDAKMKFSREDLLGSLHAAAAGVKGVLTATAYDKFLTDNPRLDDSRARPGKQVMMLRFGSWNQALQAAGLPANPKSGPPKLYDDPTHALQCVVECWRDLEEPPTAATYDNWQRNIPDAPSRTIVQRLLVSWNLGLVRAWQVVHATILDEEDITLAVPPALQPEDRGTANAQPLCSSVQESTGEHAAYRPADEEQALAASVPWTANDVQELQRSVQSHARLQNALANALVARGVVPLSPQMSDPQFDIAFVRSDDTVFVVEVKSCTSANQEIQLRLGLGQLLRYAHQLRRVHETVEPVLAVELQPTPEWLDLLASLGVHAIWERRLPETLNYLLAWTPR